MSGHVAGPRCAARGVRFGAGKAGTSALGRLRRAYAAGCVLSRPNSLCYWDSLRPCLAPRIAPLRRATS